MIAVDTNILVYAHREDSPFHEPAFQRLSELAEGAASWAIPWPCLHEFLAIVTHPRIYAPPTPLGRALDQVDAWLESPTLVHPRVRLRYEFTKKLLRKAGVSVLSAEAADDCALAQMLSLVLLGDYVSTYLAFLYGVDPTPTKVIDELKAWLREQK